MAKFLDTILRELSMSFHLTVINPSAGLKRKIQNVRIIEHTDSIPHIKENELIITTGIMLKKTEDFISFCHQLLERQVQGLVVNLGPYIPSIPPKALSALGKKLPFITLPWELETVDLEKAIYSLLLDKPAEIASAGEYLKNYMLFPEKRPVILKQLENYGYSIATKFSVFIISSSQTEDAQTLYFNRVIQIAEDSSENYQAYIQDNSMVLLFTELKELPYKSLLQVLRKSVIKEGAGISLIIGPHNTVLNELAPEYFHLLSYSQIMLKRRQRISNYRDMNLYNLLFSVKDPHYLDQIYESYYGKLLAYDETENTTLSSLLEDLFACNFNRTELSEKRYLHRNTIQYQLNKIEGILNCNLKNPHDITCLYLSYLYHCYFGEGADQ